MTEIFEKNRYNGQRGGCNVSVGRYKNLIKKKNKETKKQVVYVRKLNYNSTTGSSERALSVADLGEGQGGGCPLARKMAQSGPLWALE